MSAHSWFNRVWYQEARPPWWLTPLAALYSGVVQLRRWLYERHYRKIERVGRPVVVIGNLSVGGTGKTPLVCWLALRLGAIGRRPGIVSRGYGGSARHARRVRGNDDPCEAGDEAVLLARRSGATVAVGHDRAAAAALLVAAGCDVILSDDGLQHYALARDCEIAVVDAARRFGNGRLLPAGPLREKIGRLSRVDAIVVNGEAADLGLGPPTFTMRMQGDSAVALLDAKSRSLQSFAGKRVHAVAGIGNPERFFDLLRRHGIEVMPHALPDHAAVKAADICFDDGRPVLMTEKDAVKCERIAGADHWYVPVAAAIETAAAEQLLDIVSRAIGKG